MDATFRIHRSHVESGPTPPRRPPPCNLVIFGATGDLASRKLLPALYNLATAGSLPQPFHVIGVSRSVGNATAWAEQVRAALARFSRRPPQGAADLERLEAVLDVVPGDADDPATYLRLRQALARAAERHGTGPRTLFYLATPSSAFPVILQQLAASGLAQDPGSDGWTRVIVEKPFGSDLATARRLNELAAQTLAESQLFRIDHYLGKETVQNILVFRFGNSLFEPVWNRKYVSHVEITAAETIGIEGRGRFYEETGVLRDIVQNHLLQVLALIAMEPPITFDADEIRDMKAQALRSLRAMSQQDVATAVVRGQYDGYRDEPGVAKDSRTPTFAALEVMLDNWRWQGVPFYLRAGKALARRVTEVRVHFHAIPFCLFGREDVCLRVDPNVLTLRIQPNEGIGLRFISKVPAEDFEVRSVDMDFRYDEAFDRETPEAYERLLLDAMRGDATLFARRDEVELAWRFTTPILEAWDADPGPPLAYERGGEGPLAAHELLWRAGRRWEQLC